MTDMRKYKDVVKDAVRNEIGKDTWRWSVPWVGKADAKIAWGYLTYLSDGKKKAEDMFRVSIWVDDDDGDVMVVGKIPAGGEEYAWIGPMHWHDASTIEDGIRKVIHAMCVTARNIY